jgi:hypothetical protein
LTARYAAKIPDERSFACRLITGDRRHWTARINQLVVMGANVHALTRKPDQANLPGKVKVFGGDLTADPIQAGALNDVKSVFLFPVEGDIGPFLVKAKAAGVEHLVVLSSLAAAAEFRDLNSARYRHHRAVNRPLRRPALLTPSCARYICQHRYGRLHQGQKWCSALSAVRSSAYSWRILPPLPWPP